MSRPRQVLLFFVLTFVLTWGIGGLMVAVPGLVTRLFGSAGTSNPLFYVAVYVPSVLGIVLTALFEGKPGLAGLAKRLNPLRFNPGWYLAVLGGVPLAAAVGGLLVGDQLAFVGFGPAVGILAMAIIFDPGPVGEEFGWRGFALPRLLEQFTPLWASLILGGAWGLWHLPVLIDPAYPQYEMGITRFVLGTVTLAMSMTWIHLGSAGSILLAILFHLMVNSAGGLIGVSFAGQVLGLGIAGIVVGLIAWRRQLTASPMVRS